MIEVNAVFTKESVKAMSKGKRISNYVFFPLLGAVLLLAGILTFVFAPSVKVSQSKEKIKVLILLWKEFWPHESLGKVSGAPGDL